MALGRGGARERGGFRTGEGAWPVHVYGAPFSDLFSSAMANGRGAVPVCPRAPGSLLEGYSKLQLGTGLGGRGVPSPDS
jgi:hypothetical protein